MRLWIHTSNSGPEQLARLNSLNEELELLGFRHQMRDPVFTEYLKARTEEVRTSGDISQATKLDPATARKLVREALAQTKDESEQ